jgi:ABC-type nickel/cobalt efflux system permease component RcnA
VFLGLTVTITHTLVVFAVGFATLFASRYVVPERLFPLLSVVSGMLVLGMGMALFRRRWCAMRIAARRSAGTGSVLAGAHRVALPYRTLETAMPAGAGGRSRMLTHVHGHHHPHNHGDGAHTHHGALMHSHGGSMHSHLPPGVDGEKVSWRSLLALGVSGGLVPCPSAMVLLLAAVALNKTAYGLILVGSFSVGLAVTLVGAGFIFLYARHRLRGPLAHSQWLELLPVLSAAAIMIVGAALCYSAVSGTSFL